MQFLLLVLRYWLMIYLLFFIFFLNSLELDVRGEFSGELLCVKFIMADLFSNFLHIMRAVDSTAKSCVDHFRVILHIYLVPLPSLYLPQIICDAMYFIALVNTHVRRIKRHDSCSSRIRSPWMASAA